MNRAQQKTGKTVTFTLGAISPAKIDRVEILYGVSSNSCPELSLRGKPDIDPGLQVSARYEWNLELDDAYLPGVKIWWQWEIHDEAGNELVTEPKNIVMEDPEYTWQKLEQGQITLYWTGGELDFGKRMIDIAGRSIDRLAEKAGIQYPGKLRLVIYPSLDDLLDAVTGVPDWAGGVAYPKLDVVVIAISPQDPYQWAQRVIPHELAHLLISTAYTNCRNDPLPLWLEEGLAGYAEGKMPQEERDLIIHALDDQQLAGLETLSSTFPADEQQARLAYAHSRMVVEYLIENQGVEKMNTLLGRLRDGQVIDAALRPLYGLDTAGLDQAWRAAEGFGSAPELVFVTLTPIPTLTRTPILKTITPSPTQTELVITTTASTSPEPSGTTQSAAMPAQFPVVLIGSLICAAGIVIILYLRSARDR